MFRCPDCKGKIGVKNYDSDFEMYDCPSCGGMFQHHELIEHGEQSAAGNGSAGSQDGTRAVKKAKTKEKASRNGKGQDRRVRPGVIAKGKKRREEQESDAEADAKQIEEITKNVKATKKEERHRDEIETGLVLNVMADEIEAICAEAGISMNRTNAREFYAMNLYRPLILAGVRAREVDVPHKLCKEHK